MAWHHFSSICLVTATARLIYGPWNLPHPKLDMTMHHFPRGKCNPAQGMSNTHFIFIPYSKYYMSYFPKSVYMWEVFVVIQLIAWNTEILGELITTLGLEWGNVCLGERKLISSTLYWWRSRNRRYNVLCVLPNKCWKLSCTTLVSCYPIPRAMMPKEFL